MDNRYDKEYSYGSVKFYLSEYTLDLEQCRFLILKILEQAVRDYCSLSPPEVYNELGQWETANGFLFDDDYKIWWGDKELSPSELLDIVDLDIHWVREQTIKKSQERK